MEQNKRYEAPKMEVIELGIIGVLCASGVEPTEFNGTGMNFTLDEGQW